MADARVPPVRAQGRGMAMKNVAYAAYPGELDAGNEAHDSIALRAGIALRCVRKVVKNDALVITLAVALQVSDLIAEVRARRVAARRACWRACWRARAAPI